MYEIIMNQLKIYDGINDMMEKWWNKVIGVLIGMVIMIEMVNGVKVIKMCIKLIRVVCKPRQKALKPKVKKRSFEREDGIRDGDDKKKKMHNKSIVVNPVSGQAGVYDSSILGGDKRKEALRNMKAKGDLNDEIVDINFALETRELNQSIERTRHRELLDTANEEEEVTDGHFQYGKTPVHNPKQPVSKIMFIEKIAEVKSELVAESKQLYKMAQTQEIKIEVLDSKLVTETGEVKRFQFELVNRVNRGFDVVKEEQARMQQLIVQSRAELEKLMLNQQAVEDKMNMISLECEGLDFEKALNVELRMILETKHWKWS